MSESTNQAREHEVLTLNDLAQMVRDETPPPHTMAEVNDWPLEMAIWELFGEEWVCVDLGFIPVVSVVTDADGSNRLVIHVHTIPRDPQ